MENIQIDGVTIDLEELKQKEFIERFSELFNDGANELVLDMLDEERFGVNEVRRFKYSESILYNVNPETMLEDEKKAKDSYEHLASILVGE